MAGARAERWWLRVEGVCHFCFQGYAYGTELRCGRCDDPMCEACVAQLRGQLLCPECVADSAAR